MQYIIITFIILIAQVCQSKEISVSTDPTGAVDMNAVISSFGKKRDEFYKPKRRCSKEYLRRNTNLSLYVKCNADKLNSNDKFNELNAEEFALIEAYRDKEKRKHSSKDENTQRDMNAAINKFEQEWEISYKRPKECSKSYLATATDFKRIVKCKSNEQREKDKFNKLNAEEFALIESYRAKVIAYWDKGRKKHNPDIIPKENDGFTRSSTRSAAYSKYSALIRKNMAGIYIGMSKNDFLALFPLPRDPLLKDLLTPRSEITYSIHMIKRVSRTTTASGVTEQWACKVGSDDAYYYFTKDILRSIQD